MQQVFALIERIAPTDSTVLVTGESGTGKEMVVRAIHRHSRRGDYPLLACDCTALAPTLLESELFGHVKGSFSGAIATKMGLFEVAHQGHAVPRRSGQPEPGDAGQAAARAGDAPGPKVGDTAEHEVDIRLIATTNRSLAEMVKAGAFRADLYYRLNVVPISLPPLRERRGDIPCPGRRLPASSSAADGRGGPGILARGHAADGQPTPGRATSANCATSSSVWPCSTTAIGSRAPARRKSASTAPVRRRDAAATWEELKRLKRQFRSVETWNGSSCWTPWTARAEHHPGRRERRDAADELPRDAAQPRRWATESADLHAGRTSRSGSPLTVMCCRCYTAWPYHERAELLAYLVRQRLVRLHG